MAATAYLVTTGEYDYYQAIAVLAIEDEAQMFADDYNRRNQGRAGAWAEVQPIDFYAAGWRPDVN
jgi:hypothetical protein